MLLEKQLQVYIFEVSNDKFEILGEVNQLTSLIWPSKYNGYAGFSLWAPITEENARLLREGNVIWCGGDDAAIIEMVKSESNDENERTLNVKGRTLEALLTTRIIWGTYSVGNQWASNIMYEVVNAHCVNPTDVTRKIPWLECAPVEPLGGIVAGFQKTGGEVYEALSKIADDANLGFDVLFRPREQKLIFKVVQGVDRSRSQSVVDPIEFSTDMEDILASAYYINSDQVKHVALVMGEESGSTRKQEVSGDAALAGLRRRELYVDARDLQSKYITAGGAEVELTPQEYTNVLLKRGSEKLSECSLVETFEAKVRVVGAVQYEYGIDYNKGDMVTVRDTQLGIITDAQVTEVEESFGESYSLSLTFGYSYPTLLERVKQVVG